MRGLLKKLRMRQLHHAGGGQFHYPARRAKSGMMKEYIQRFHHPENFNYLHPVMKEQLEETYGVMVYQEDVLKVCHHFAGLDLADADVLRRAMSGKYRSKKELERIVDKFFSNCEERGYPELTTRCGGRSKASPATPFRRPTRFLRRGEFPEPLPEGPLPA
jgi:hypothetical protein